MKIYVTHGFNDLDCATLLEAKAMIEDAIDKWGGDAKIDISIASYYGDATLEMTIREYRDETYDEQTRRLEFEKNSRLRQEAREREQLTQLQAKYIKE